MPYQILPLKSAARTWGLLVVEPENLRQLMIPEQQRLLETFTLLVASALERLTLTASEEQARLTSERESLRNSLLAALSHDLRTPLTVLFGQAEILTSIWPAKVQNMPRRPTKSASMCSTPPGW